MPLTRISANGISDGTVVAADISNRSVTGTKIATFTVEANNIANTSITSSQLASGAATTAKINIDSDLNFNAANVKRVGLGESNVSSSSNIVLLNYSNTSVFVSQFFENTTLKPNNVPAGGCVMLLKANNAGSYTISYNGNVRFAANTAPTLTASAQDYLLFICDTDTRYFVTAQTNVVQNK